MKIAEIWGEAEARLAERGAADLSRMPATFAGGVRAVAVELLTHAKDLVDDGTAKKLYARLMNAADRIDPEKADGGKA